uniref:Uncharacterized protein n=1 Tax=Strigamia maritima TaxID=126957 RepID=T1ILG5_STRMM
MSVRSGTREGRRMNPHVVPPSQHTLFMRGFHPNTEMNKIRYDNSTVIGSKITITWFKDLRRARLKAMQHGQRWNNFYGHMKNGYGRGGSYMHNKFGSRMKSTVWRQQGKGINERKRTFMMNIGAARAQVGVTVGVEVGVVVRVGADHAVVVGLVVGAMNAVCHLGTIGVEVVLAVVLVAGKSAFNSKVITKA